MPTALYLANEINIDCIAAHGFEYLWSMELPPHRQLSKEEGPQNKKYSSALIFSIFAT